MFRKVPVPEFESLRLALLLLMVTTTAACDMTTSDPHPPFHGTIFIDPDIITADDPTAFVGLKYTGRGERSMFDRRGDRFVALEPYLFVARYDDGKKIEIQVNPEFGSVEAAEEQAAFYAPVFGRLPALLREDVKTSWIHKGDFPFGGGNNNLLIHTGRLAQEYMRDGILEEALAHEAAHTSLDRKYVNDPDWLRAQKSDPDFISVYARDNLAREDIAESYVPWLAVRYRRDRIPKKMAEQIEQAIPARLAFFDIIPGDLHPW
ncbi:MAG: hypothetical protein AB7Q81_24110 [Gammaproteobacteria bacterium]